MILFLLLALSASGNLGPPSAQIKSSVVDLGDPSATVTNDLATNTTTSPNTTVADSSYSFTLQQSLTQGKHEKRSKSESKLIKKLQELQVFGQCPINVYSPIFPYSSADLYRCAESDHGIRNLPNPGRLSDPQVSFSLHSNLHLIILQQKCFGVK